MKLIVIYPGRFQPFGPHHFKTYQWLTKRFGSENVFIATSDHTDLNSPLNFEEKKRSIQMYHVMDDKIIKVKNPYKAEELLEHFNPNETAVIYAYGEKDFGRIKFFKQDGSESYFSEYYGQKNLKPFSERGYALEVPHMSVKINGRDVDGTYLRQILPLAKKIEYNQIMGYYDEDLHDLFKKRFHPDITELVEMVLLEGDRITKTQLQRIEQYADKLFKEFAIDINFQNLSNNTHFYQRLNDPRNQEPITSDELRQLFKKASMRYGYKLQKSSPGIEAVLKDMETDINLPFMIKYDSENKELDLVPKTIMRKKDFKTNSPVLQMENVIDLITGNVGKYQKHIFHPYEDKTLTFTDLENLLEFLYSPDFKCSLKLDGQNLQVTWKDNQLLCSRNKSTIKNPMTLSELSLKYENKPDVQKAFTDSFIMLENQLLKLPKKYLEQIFKNGTVFLNFEVIHPATKNIFDYGKEPQIYIHSLIEYDLDGNEIGRTSEIPVNLISDSNILLTPKFKVHLNDNLNYFLNKLLKLKLVCGCENLFEIKNPILFNKLKLFIWELGNSIIKDLVKRENIKGSSKQQIDILTKTRLKCKNKEDKLKFKQSYQNLQTLGGINSLNMIEGLVFEWNNRTMKLTGSFGCLVPIFQIYGRERYGK